MSFRDINNQSVKKKLKSLNPTMKNTIFFTAAVIILMTLFSTFSSQSALTVACDDTRIGIAYSNGEAREIDYEDIVKIDLLDHLDLGEAVSAQDSKKFIVGKYKNEKYGIYSLYGFLASDKYIQINTNEEVIILNQATTAMTEKFYKEILDKKRLLEDVLIANEG